MDSGSWLHGSLQDVEQGFPFLFQCSANTNQRKPVITLDSERHKDFGSSSEGFGWFSVRPWVTLVIFGCLRFIFDIATRKVISEVISHLFTGIIVIHGFITRISANM